MTTAIIFIQDCDSNRIRCRALLDTGATANFISINFAKRLKLPISPCTISVGAIDYMSTKTKGAVRIIIQSRHDKFAKELTCLIVPTISDLVPFEVFSRKNIKLPEGITLADPEFHVPRPIDLLIGSSTTLSLLSTGQVDLSNRNRDLYLQNTRLGWIIAGGVTTGNNYTKGHLCSLTDLESQMAKFWATEEITDNSSRSIAVHDSETHFLENVIRNNDGRYVVRLPFRNKERQLGNSRNVALKRFYSLERKLELNPELKTAYTQIFEEYLNLNQMTLINDPSDDGFYMPHHAVIKATSDTTRVRVVFDASAKSEIGMSLNDLLLIGPTIQDNLFAHLIPFRIFKIVLNADIEKMYRQIWLHEDDQRYQRVLWRYNNEIRTFQLNTITFGVASSPFLAIRTVHKLADDDGDRFPDAARLLKTHLYVDDLLIGTDTVEEARRLRDEVIALLARGGFNIRQWAFNDRCVIEDLNPDAINSNLDFDKTNSLKMLGVAWDARNDALHYSVRKINHVERFTKRMVVAEIAKMFDPLGVIGPVTLFAKRIMQDLWKSKIGWDEHIPPSIQSTWTEFMSQLEIINDLPINRAVVIPEHNDIQIHGFCDASKVGYGACLYIRSKNQNDRVHCRLLCVKNRVAPLKSVKRKPIKKTIPRLELCGALLLAKLYGEVRKAAELNPDKVILWSDSMITLHWIRTSPHSLKTYVSHRVAQIQEITEPQIWRHVNSKDNPADALSRGQMPGALLNNQHWFSGPSWLIKNENEWPQDCMKPIEIPEMKGNKCLSTDISNKDILQKYSSYTKTLRIVALCLRFRRKNAYQGPLCAQEIEEAEIRVTKIFQASRFASELKKLTNKQTANKKIASLDPFIDQHGLIRVGGRLRKSNLTFAQKHPILIPNNHFLTDLIIKETHERYFHSGIQTTLYTIRQKFWLLDGRNQVRKIVRSCIRCFRFNANAIRYKMGDLPKSRVTEAIPFANTGVDFCGPFYIKEKKYRNRNRIKTYVCVFVCMVVKAVHLEVVSDLTTEGFLAVLRRFVSRRGIPTHIFSDNGTNFIGASNHLRELYILFNSDEHKDRVNRFAIDHRITWHFIPPIAPHFGGLWESTVKLFKHHYKRVVGDLLFTFEELNTFTTEIEGILNSRPISYLSSDPNDPIILSPAHCMIGKPIMNMPEHDYSSVPAARLSTWQHLSKVRQDFWTRWSQEYLSELQTRHKWNKEERNIEVGTIVLLKEKNLPCSQWAMGRITEIHPGEDGVVRTATIKTSAGILKRTTKCLCPLPLEQ
ncbi:uncharacterized protein LOC113006176 [Solenopsis invicta]|uniref:uncharacterized protein LOC113006176 n=1 Tax=Solenopsis invicta TaxID=13686 RepID=UPI00193D424E|nr:uncharacterized protein LOC113006176 [Solenopsis invicta]